MRRVVQGFVCFCAVTIAQCRSLGSPNDANVQDLVQTESLPDAKRIAISDVAQWSRNRVRDAEEVFKATGLTRYPSPEFWGAESVYQIMVDRFNDGDSSNNFALVSDEQRHATLNRYRDLPFYHHGGDIKGVTDRLDYLSDLGVSTIWLTPVLLNSAGDYHGYCTTDFTQIDPNYGTKQDLVNMVREAHKRGIRVILDVVINHMCDANTRYAQVHTQTEHQSCAHDLERESDLSLPTHSPSQKNLDFSNQFFPPLRNVAFFNRCGGNTQAEMEGAGPTSTFGDFTAEMLDFDTRNYDFQEIFTDLMKYWVAYADVDGFRLDAVKHVTPDFTAYLSTAMRDYGQKLGKNHLYIVAEIAAESRTMARHLGKMDLARNTKSVRDRLASPISLDEPETVGEAASHVVRFPFPGSSGVYDFAHSGISRDVFQLKRSSRILEQYFTEDPYYKDLKAQGDPRLNLTLLEIHDWNRFNAAFPEDVARSKLGLSYLAVAPGIPIIYYGMEQGFNGQCREGSVASSVDSQAMHKHCSVGEGPARHPLYRQDMFRNGMLRLGSSVKSIDALAYIGPLTKTSKDTWEMDPFLDRNHELYRATRRMLHLRRSCFPLMYGDMVWRWSSSENGGLFAFSRLDNGREVLVVVNPGTAAVRIPALSVTTAGSSFVNVENPSIVGQPTDGAKIDFGDWLLQPASLAVFVPRASLGPWSEKYGVHLCRDGTQVQAGDF